MSDVESELREQFRTAFEGADYPVTNQMDLLPALPNGAGTRFEAGEFEMSAMELGSKLSGSQEFPYDDVDSLVEDIIAGLKEKDYI